MDTATVTACPIGTTTPMCHAATPSMCWDTGDASRDCLVCGWCATAHDGARYPCRGVQIVLCRLLPPPVGVTLDKKTPAPRVVQTQLRGERSGCSRSIRMRLRGGHCAASVRPNSVRQEVPEARKRCNGSRPGPAQPCL